MTIKDQMERLVRSVWPERDFQIDGSDDIDTIHWFLAGRFYEVRFCLDYGLGALDFSVLCPLCLEEVGDEHDSMFVPLDAFIDRLRKFRSACQVWLRSPFRVNPQISADNSLDGVIFEDMREIDPADLDDIKKNLEALNIFLV